MIGLCLIKNAPSSFDKVKGMLEHYSKGICLLNGRDDTLRHIASIAFARTGNES